MSHDIIRLQSGAAFKPCDGFVHLRKTSYLSVELTGLFRFFSSLSITFSSRVDSSFLSEKPNSSFLSIQSSVA